MKNIYFITGNEFKFKEASNIIPNLEQLDIDLIEIQEINPQKVIEHKINEAISISSVNNLIVEDTVFGYNALNGFPGTFIKWMYESIGIEGMWKVIENFEDKSGFIKTTIGLKLNGGDIKYFESNLEVNVVKPRGENGFGWDPIIEITKLGKTQAELTEKEKGAVSSRGDVFRQVQKFIETV